MREVRLKQFIQMTSVVAGVIGLAADAGYASETTKFTETGEFAAVEMVPLSSEDVISSPEFQAEPIASVSFEAAEFKAAGFEAAALSVAPASINHLSVQSESLFVQPLEVVPDAHEYVFQIGSPVEPVINVQRSNSVDSTVLISEPESVPENSPSDSVNIFDSAQALPEFEPLISSSADLGAAQAVDQQQIAQAETPTETNPSEPAPETEETGPRWRFSLAPYGFVPFSVEGSASVGDLSANIDLGLDDILSPLNFAAAGRVEAWRGNLGIIFDGSYFSLSQENTRSLSTPNCLCNIFPSEITADVKLQYGQFDLGVGYRVAENANQAVNEFELGPLVFDAIAGIRIYTLRQEINLSTDLGTEISREGNGTLVQPLISGRLRWNLSPKLAGWVRGDLAGLGLGGTLLAASFTGGFDWMFAGDTSLLLAYRISSLQYSTEIGNENLDLNLLLHGPYLGVVFRF